MHGREGKTIAKQTETPRAEQIARLNDLLRTSETGGQIMITRGVTAIPEFSGTVLVDELRRYVSFDIDNDPHGERDFGDLTIWGKDLLWKIDYYDKAFEFASPDPADEGVTNRVLTVMLASEY